MQDIEIFDRVGFNPFLTPVVGPKHLQVVLHATLHHSVPTPRPARAVSVTLVDGRVLRPLQSSVGIPHRLFAGGDSLRLLHGEPPALTGRAVGTVVRAGARDEKAGVCLDVDPGANLSVIDVVEVLRWVGCDGIDTLVQWEGEEKAGQRVQFRVPVVVKIKADCTTML